MSLGLCSLGSLSELIRLSHLFEFVLTLGYHAGEPVVLLLLLFLELRLLGGQPRGRLRRLGLQPAAQLDSGRLFISQLLVALRELSARLTKVQIQSHK